MIKWIDVESDEINKIAFNAEIGTMYMRFKESIVDTPYIGVTKKMFTELSQSDNFDGFFENHIKYICEKVELNTEYSVDCRL